MSEIIAHPTNENLRIRLTVDDCPSKPYNDGGFPIWRLDLSRHYTGWAADQETDLTSYSAPSELDDAIGRLFRDRDLPDDTLERHLRIFWGATFVAEWHSGSYWYVAADPQCWREHAGITDEITALPEYADDPFDEFAAWVTGNVWLAWPERRVWQRTTTRTWDPAGAEHPGDPASSDEIGEDTDEYYAWVPDDRETYPIGGFYGDPDDITEQVTWNFAWPTASHNNPPEGAA